MYSFRLLGLCAFVTVLLVGCPGAAEPVLDDSRISVEEIVNRVETGQVGNTPGQQDFKAAEIGQELLPGSGVKTFQDSEARVDIRIQELLRIIRTTPNTLWRLTQFAIDGETIVALDEGKVFLMDDGVGGDLRPFKVVTPAGTASPRGTIWSVAFDPLTGITTVDCFRGICEMENANETQVIRGGSGLPRLLTSHRPFPRTWRNQSEADSLVFRNWFPERSIHLRLKTKPRQRFLTRQACLLQPPSRELLKPRRRCRPPPRLGARHRRQLKPLQHRLIPPHPRC